MNKTIDNRLKRNIFFKLFFLPVLITIMTTMTLIPFTGSGQIHAKQNDGIKRVTVFFDIGDTLGKAVISRSPLKIERIDIYDFVKPILKRLREKRSVLELYPIPSPATAAR